MELLHKKLNSIPKLKTWGFVYCESLIHKKLLNKQQHEMHVLNG